MTSRKWRSGSAATTSKVASWLATSRKVCCPRNPFETIDHRGVGDLMRTCIARARTVKPDLKMGVCGEHGGDPASIALFAELGIDYVSCSPFRVPIARLAGVQAVLALAAGAVATE